MPVLHKTVGHLLCVLKQMSNEYNIFDKQIKTMLEWPKVISPIRQQTHLKGKKNHLKRRMDSAKHSVLSNKQKQCKTENVNLEGNQNTADTDRDFQK